MMTTVQSRRRSLPFVRNQAVEPPCCFSHAPLMASTIGSRSRSSVGHSRSRPSLTTSPTTTITTTSLPSATALHSAPIIASLFFRNFWKKKGRRPERRHGHRAATFEGGILAPVKEQHSAPHHVPSLALPLSSYFMDALPLELERELLEVEEHVPVNIPADVALGGEVVAFEHPPSALFVENHIDNDEAASSAVEKDSLSDDNSNPRDAVAVADNQLNASANEDDDHNDDPEEIINDNDDHKILIHTYNANDADAITYSAANNVNKNNDNNNELTLMGVGMPQRQFATWVRYYLLHMTQEGEAMPTPIIPTAQTQPNQSSSNSNSNNNNEEEALVMMKRISRQITTQEVDYENEWDDHVPKVRECWREGKLICEHTNLLSGSGRSRQQGEGNEQSQTETAEATTTIEKSEEQLQKEQKEEELRMKSQHFRDVLGSYADRLASIVEDELSEHAHYNMNMMGASGGNDLLQRPYFAEVVDTMTGARNSEHNNGQSQQQQDHQQQQNLQMAPKWTTENGLRGWIEHEYGLEGTRLLLADTLLRKSEEEQLKTFQAFLDWFRGKFPYFHDKCDSCGASCKDDPLELQQQQQEGEVKVFDDGSGIETAHHGGEQTNGQADEDIPSINIINEDDDDNEEDYDYPFLGYVHPTPTELLGNATRTELYHCRSCSSFTRFPRYNRALWVTSALRGRCGEYSMLLYRMLRVLGYGEIRWVVDWADHVWVEVWLGEDKDEDKVGGGGGERSESGKRSDGRWVHLDPCEAAVDNPLLYESWGKNQTYIVAFHDPFYNHHHHVNSDDRDATTTTTSKDDEMERSGAFAFPSLVPTKSLYNNGVQLLEREREKRETMLRSRKFPPVEDVTRQYTSDETHVIQERRGISDEPVAEAIEEVSETMVQLLRSIVDRR